MGREHGRAIDEFLVQLKYENEKEWQHVVFLFMSSVNKQLSVEPTNSFLIYKTKYFYVWVFTTKTAFFSALLVFVAITFLCVFC